jgi:alkyldihydroxyacetonephosphate synthase
MTRDSVVRRWNGWGDEAVEVHPSAPLRSLLLAAIGPGTPAPEATFTEVCAAVPSSRLPAHAWIDTDPSLRVRHARGQSLPDLIALRSGRGLVFPDGVARPADETEVAAILHFAVERGLTIIPYGGGTSVVGHVNPVAGPAPVLTVSLARLGGLRRFDAESRLATFGAGTRGPDIEAALRPLGSTLGHFPQSFEHSTLGGWIATRSSGQQSRGYGRIEDLFAGGTVITPAGPLRLPPFPASAAGPDLRHLVLGSEGRIGLITDAVVRVSPRPEVERFDGVFFPGWAAAFAASRALAQSGVPISMLRVSTPGETATHMALAGRPRALRALEIILRLRGTGEGKCLAIVGVSGAAKQAKAARSAALDLLRGQGGLRVGAMGEAWRRSRFRTPYLRNTLWTMGYAVDTVETATPWSTVERVLGGIEGALRGALADRGERVHAFTHLSHLYPTGASIYTTFVFRPGSGPDEALARWRVLKAAASEAVLREGGTISHQHGVGADHAAYLEIEKGALGLRALGGALAAFDADGRLNPGKLLRRGEGS